MHTRMLTIGLGLAAALCATPALAEDSFSTFARNGERVLVAEREYRYTVYDGGRHGRHGRHRKRHRHTAACDRVWIPGGYETVTERQWVAGQYENVTSPWKVEWKWTGHTHRGEHLRVVTDSPYPPERPNRWKYGRGRWQRRVIERGHTDPHWVPGHYETVERQIPTSGRYEFACSRF